MISYFNSSWLLYVVLPLIAVYLYYNLNKKKYRLPPGPKPWPIIGSIPDPYSTPLMYKKLMDKWIKKYGDVILFKRFGMNFVYVNDYKIGNQAFAQTYPKELAGRPTNGVDRLSVGDRDIFFTRSMGPEFIELRKQIMIMLRKSAEPKRMFEISNISYELFANHIKEHKAMVKDDGFYVEPLCYWVGHNLLTEIFWKESVSFDDEDYQDTISTIKKLMDEVGNLSFFDITPLNALPIPGKTRILKYSDHLSNKIRNLVQERRAGEDYKNDPLYFVDHCINIQENQLKYSEMYPNLPIMDDWFISNLALDVYFAGMDAFGIGFTWTIGLLATHPSVQEKIRNEINTLSEKYNESFNIKWIDEMHYTNSVINEVMRYHSLSSFTSFHRAMEDVKIGEYDIPKETIVVLNIYGAHFDPRYWTNPERFNPERFLDEEGKFKLPKEGFMPFGSGRRICVAERYTVKESHIVFTARICQDFNIVWSKNNGKKPLHEDMENTFFRHTAPFNVEFNGI